MALSLLSLELLSATNVISLSPFLRIHLSASVELKEEHGLDFSFQLVPIFLPA
ncbi:hypothetical protein F2Q68_00015539 [Brassica cretica]|uniref:Uncharacterized protein n=1 Tax=Brassica cretica TaxID=69181 RepID=A0A8S9HPW8_BRACR|nr:hypothetical protein F2Q68_00015539 [Brassica cretica]KAF3589444.1 hypothetical protein F2Q69_00029346 [Brassica cretica]